MTSDWQAPHQPSGPRLEPEEKRFLARLFTYGLTVRVLLAIGLDLSGYSLMLAPDEITYANRGKAIAAHWSGRAMAPQWQLMSSAPAYYYVNGALFYVLGSSMLPIKLLNCVVGALASRYAYFIARSLFGQAVARRAATLVMFLPSLVLWSTVNIRDVWAISLLLVVAWNGLQLVSTFSIRALAALVAAIALLSYVREYLFWVVAVPPVAALLLGQRARSGRNFVVALLTGITLVLVSRQIDLGQSGRGQVTLEAMAEARSNLSRGGSAFGGDIDISTPGRALRYLPVGLVYFFFSPFPWQITTTLKLLTLPEMLLIYYLTPSLVRGVLYTIRFRFRASLQILLMFSLLACAYALVEGNVGTLYRHRAQAISFFLIFAAVGQRRPRPDSASTAVAASNGWNGPSLEPSTSVPGVHP